MSADVGFTPGKLIEGAQGIEAAAEPFSQAVSTIGEDVTSASEGINGPFMEPLSNALTMWGDSLSVLFDDLGGPVRKLLTVCLCGCCPGRLV